MRKIKFRGKNNNKESKYYGKFVYGYYAFLPAGASNYEDTHYILVPHIQSLGNTLDRDEVDPNTVGQYTGLKDKNGVEIYEGDILSFGFGTMKYKIVYKTNFAQYYMEKLDGSDLIGLSSLQMEFIEVIGNIHE